MMGYKTLCTVAVLLQLGLWYLEMLGIHTSVFAFPTIKGGQNNALDPTQIGHSHF